jgi:hypothetical protein
MSAPGSIPPERVPTLTEVVAWPEATSKSASAAAPPPPDAQARAEPVAAPTPTPAPARSLPPGVSEDQIVERVLADLQRQVDLMLDYRMREVLTPILSRAVDSILRDTRQELASTLRDAVGRAVAQELSRHRSR